MLKSMALFLIIETPIIIGLLVYFKGKPPPANRFFWLLWKLAKMEEAFAKMIKFWRELKARLAIR